MQITPYIDYFKKVLREIKKLSKETNIAFLRLFFDYILAVIRHGTLIRQYTIGEFWKKSNFERKRCLTYPRMVKLMKKYNNSHYIPLLNSKTQFNDFFKEFVKRDWLYLKESTFEQFSSFVQKHDTVIIKPINGVEGFGIRKFIYSKYQKNNLENLFIELQNEDVLVEECILQHSKMFFGNTSVNTIRTMTILDKNGQGHVVKAMLRAGVGDTVVDNYCQGGSIYEIDINTGVVNSYGKSKAGELHIYHPNTNIVMLGYKIPKWNEVINISKQAAEHIPQVRIIGWDVAITNDGVQLIEGNHNPDYELYEYLGSNGYYKIFKELLK